jgi:hypothetical protein
MRQYNGRLSNALAGSRSAFNRITRNPQRLCNVAASREARGRVGPAGDRLSCSSLCSAQTRSLTAQGLLSLGVL